MQVKSFVYFVTNIKKIFLRCRSSSIITLHWTLFEMQYGVTVALHFCLQLIFTNEKSNRLFWLQIITNYLLLCLSQVFSTGIDDFSKFLTF